MSSALAIASVTYVLKDLLNDGLINREVSNDINGSVLVTAQPPDQVDTVDEQSQLNLFMYMVTPNSGWRNVGFPSHDNRADRIANPPLALDLHYLLTAYGSAELHHEVLLGYGMQLLHETPVLARDAIKYSLAPASLPTEWAALATSKLADQVELIKITPETLNTEEISRLWAAFGSKYRPHAAYKATVVLIESEQSTKSALPVKSRNIYVRPFHQPVIEKIRFQTAEGEAIPLNQRIITGSKMVIHGMQLKGEITSVSVGGIVINSFDSIGDNQIVLSLPNTLSAGIIAVQVVHGIQMGLDTGTDSHNGSSSNVEAFVFSPRIDSTSFTNPVSDSNDLISGNLQVNIVPDVEENQEIRVLLNQIDVAEGVVTNAYSFPLSIANPTAPTGNISLPVSGIVSGLYLVRIQIDGAESPLDDDYQGPTVDI